MVHKTDSGELVPVIRVIKEKCINCHRCIAVCPVKMCNDGSGDTISLRAELCVGCGECIRICKYGARVGIDDFDSFMQDIKAAKPIIAVVAPAIVANFGNNYLKFNGFLKKLGVKAVFDVSFGAELTIKSYVAYKKKQNPKLIIAQPCSSLVSFIELYHPELIGYLAPADSPMGHIMKAVRKFYPQYADCKIAAFSPCYAKRREFNSVGIGDYNVTFASIKRHLEDTGDNLMNYGDYNYENPPAERGVNFSTPGGLMQTFARYDKNAVYFTRKVEGVPEVYQYLAQLKFFLKEHSPSCYLVDCLNCRLGCNGGPGAINQDRNIEEVEMNTEKRSREVQAQYKRSFFSKKKFERTFARYWQEGLFTRSYVDRSALFREIVRRPSKDEFASAYKRLHKYTENDFLDCGCCGYKNCEQMAVAIINGLNKPEHCWYYIMEQSKKDEERYQSRLKSAIEKIYNRVFEEINGNINGINALLDRITETVSHVNASSSTIETMVYRIQSVNENVKRNAQTVTQLNVSSLEGKGQMLKIGELAGKMAEQSDMLIRISKIIESVYQKTQVLGMNASIEAAHAGDIGRGFAVVAGEIRHLAQTAGTQSKDIEQSLSNIKSLIDKSAASSVNAQNQFERIITLVNAVKEEDGSIAQAVERESDNGKQVIDALTTINQLILTIRNETALLLDSSKTVLENMGSLKNI
ncbi:MAG: methyl-accepting chemotaxis protein [Spirochaetaceae bacterium]|jgi:iron only hydrogenase large subunit-like protein|nr:methyl-accepting chemotaxis protein [Spirochaetaceae bacterium]